MTIIVPVYKVEKYLRRCLDSLVNQTYKNLEIILVDDGSPDNCGAICDEFVQKDSRISVIHKENGGLGSARNAGLEICNGVYVLFVDSDDWVENNYVEVMLDYKTENNIVCCGYNAVYSGEVITNCIGEIKKYTALSFIDTMLTFGLENANGTASNPIGNYMWNKMWSKSFFVSTKFQNCKYEDCDICLDLIFQTDDIITIPNCLYNYLQRNDSIVHITYSDSCKDLINALLKQESILHKYRDLYSKVRMLTALGTVNCLKCEKLADGEYQWYKKIAKDRVSVKMLAYKVVFIKVLLLLYADWLFRLLFFLKRTTLRKRDAI